MVEKSKLRSNAQQLRKSMTKEERHLWYDFLNHYPIPIHRQYLIGDYIADFYCHRAKLVIELDGSQHYEPNVIEYDHNRTKYMESRGLVVLRYSNLEIMRDFRGVCEHLDMVIKARCSEQASTNGK